FRLLDDRDQALGEARRAVASSPNAYEPRWVLGEQLFEAGDLDGARAAFQWCQRRRPTDAKARQALEAIARRGKQSVAARPLSPPR
ncbi:MAG TPA: hypothetical protein VIY86_09200, partial [Pirellulaceae bacterium]